MLDRLRDVVLRLARVPAEPTPPAGDPDGIRVFRAAPRYFRYKLIGWGVGQLGTLIGLVFGTVALGLLGDAATRWLPGLIVGVVGGLAWLAYLTQLPLTLAALRLDYEMRWYMLSDRSLRIREGILSVQEKTMTFANIQQIGVRQGPVQRLLGIADVEVRTAGGGSAGQGEGPGRDMHRGYFRGVADAEGIRDAIRERVRRYRDAGLGDPDEAVASGGVGVVAGGATRTEPGARPATAATLEAAHELLDEVRALRRAVTSGA